MATSKEKSHMNILLVDKTGRVLDLLKSLEGRQGFYIEQVGTKAEAVSRIKQEAYDGVVIESGISDKEIHSVIEKAQPGISTVTVTPGGIEREDDAREASASDMPYYSGYMVFEGFMFPGG